MFVPIGGQGGSALRTPLTLNLPGSLNVAIKVAVKVTKGVAMKVAKKMRIGGGWSDDGGHLAE